ncbi:MAG TPA: ABC transporter ATP-binding protein [Acidimicrobiia bacterium]|nr:ABC transporter ATP-binding protein [Acidimicrobiia bacterium]
MASRTPLIEARKLTKKYGDLAAVNGINLSIAAGEVFGLLGPNGAGKTTTILMLLGLTEPTSGSARVGGLDPTREPLAVKRRVGYMPDAVGFYEDMTGRENLRYTARLNEVEDELVEDRIQTLLEEVGLADAADSPVGTYSRGMRQRLGVADALVKDPQVVILDEPTAAIDPQGVADMLELIRNLAHRDGRAVLLSSHLLHQVQEICDRIAIFVKGKVVAEGTPDELGAKLAKGQARFEVVADTTEEALRGALGDQVTVRGEGSRWQVTLPSAQTRSVLRKLVDADIPVRGLTDLNADLDEIYRRYFEREEVSA